MLISSGKEGGIITWSKEGKVIRKFGDKKIDKSKKFSYQKKMFS